MKLGAVARYLSTAFLIFAAVLIAYGLYGMSRFVLYQGMYVDDGFILFDNGFYPFFWGCLFLLIGQVLRLHWRRQVMIVAAAASLVFLIWKRVTVPALSTGGQELFPDAGLLSELIVVAVVLLGFALADRYVQIVIDAIVVRPFRRLTGSND